MNRLAEQSLLRFADKQMDVVRHDDIAADYEIVTEAHGLKRTLEKFARRCVAQVLESVIARVVDEVKTAALLITNEPFRHGCILHPMSQNRDMGHPDLLVRCGTPA